MKQKFYKSLDRIVSKDVVIDEYTRVSQSPKEFQKAKWSSEASMLNRFRLGLDQLQWDQAQRWLDVGCGTGKFFSVVEDSGYCFELLMGVDIVPELVHQAERRCLNSVAEFKSTDMDDLPMEFQNFDVVSLVGVLQRCGLSPQRMLRLCTERLKSNGQLFLTTKHIGWRAFTEEGKSPEPSHSWFDYAELEEIILELGVRIVSAGGFLPRQNLVVPLQDSHTMFIVGRKE